MQSPAHGDRGIGRYIRQHAEALHDAAPDLIDRFLLNSRFTVPPAADGLLGTGRVAFAADALDRPNRTWSIFHVMSPFEFDVPFSEIWPAPVRDARLVVTLYDLIPHIYEDVYLADCAVRVRYKARLGLLRAADLVLAISEASRRDAIELLGLDPERVHAIGGGVGPEFAATDQPAAQLVTGFREAMPTLRDGFVLYPGGADFRKNMPGLIRAFGLLPESRRRGHQLVIVCRLPPGTEEELRATAERAGLGSDELILPGFVDDETLVGLYQAAHLVVFASLYEGFGLPIAEAMACGAPVIASNTSALPELVRRTEATFDPGSEASIAEVLGRALQDDLLRDRLREDAAAMRPQLGWEHVARRTLDALDAVSATSPVAPRRARRPRLAVLSPYPPQFSGIAAYTRSLLPHLSELCDVHCFVDGPVTSFDVTGDESWAMLNQGSFPTMHALVGYDRVLYCMGNSHFHHFIVEHLRAIPGDVLVHDVRLTGYYTWEAQNGFDGVGLRAYRQYGDRLPAAILGAQVISPTDSRELGIWLLGEVLRLRAPGIGPLALFRRGRRARGVNNRLDHPNRACAVRISPRRIRGQGHDGRTVRSSRRSASSPTPSVRWTSSRRSPACSSGFRVRRWCSSASRKNRRSVRCAPPPGGSVLRIRSRSPVQSRSMTTGRGSGARMSLCSCGRCRKGRPP